MQIHRAEKPQMAQIGADASNHRRVASQRSPRASIAKRRKAIAIESGRGGACGLFDWRGGVISTGACLKVGLDRFTRENANPALNGRAAPNHCLVRGPRGYFVRWGQTMFGGALAGNHVVRILSDKRCGKGCRKAPRKAIPSAPAFWSASGGPASRDQRGRRAQRGGLRPR